MAAIRVLVTEVSEYEIIIDTDTGMSNGGYYDDVLDAVDHENPQEIYDAMRSTPNTPSVQSASVYVYESDGSLVFGKMVFVD